MSEEQKQKRKKEFEKHQKIAREAFEHVAEMIKREKKEASKSSSRVLLST